ncbi:hypothetical protein B0H11DRAFT_2234200 [Mycena galericulata]|nr:hypothetical protein B0H11DRAFT_2234200 [Mycena galericulata]
MAPTEPKRLLNSGLCRACASMYGVAACQLSVPCPNCNAMCAPEPTWHQYVPPQTPNMVPVPVRWRQVITPNNTAKNMQTAVEITAGPSSNAMPVPTSEYWGPHGYVNTGTQWNWTSRVPLIQRPAARAPIKHHMPTPPPLPRPGPPKQVVVPLVTDKVGAERPTPIIYQTLELLLIDLNRLLCTPHDGAPFDFRGTCSIIADPAVSNANKVTDVVWEILRLTTVSFNPHTLAVHQSPYAARATTPTCALWMNAPPDPRLEKVTVPRPCNRCEHLMSIGVERCAGPLVGGKDITGLRGQRINVDLRHFEK